MEFSIKSRGLPANIAGLRLIDGSGRASGQGCARVQFESHHLQPGFT
jgi:hypothetical protein